jgi:hypothetical protein
MEQANPIIILIRNQNWDNRIRLQMFRRLFLAIARV